MIINDLLEVIEVFVDPVLENVENSKLDRLFVFLPEAFQILPDLKIGLGVGPLRVRSRVRRELRVRNVEPLQEDERLIIKNTGKTIRHEECFLVVLACH